MNGHMILLYMMIRYTLIHPAPRRSALDGRASLRVCSFVRQMTGFGGRRTRTTRPFSLTSMLKLSVLQGLLLPAQRVVRRFCSSGVLMGRGFAPSRSLHGYQGFRSSPRVNPSLDDGSRSGFGAGMASFAGEISAGGGMCASDRRDGRDASSTHRQPLLPLHPISPIHCSPTHTTIPTCAP